MTQTEKTAVAGEERLSVGKSLVTAFVMMVFFTVVLGFVYPAVTTWVGGAIFSDKAEGSLIRDEAGRVIGSKLIGQNFENTGLFEGRPSATGEKPYNPMASSGTNMAQSNPDLQKAVKERSERWHKLTGNTAPVPMDLVTSSSSGLDPQISLDAALYQVPYVAKKTGLSAEVLTKLARDCATSDPLAFGGVPLVNVLELNLKVIALQKKK